MRVQRDGGIDADDRQRWDRGKKLMEPDGVGERGGGYVDK